jgi:hypothetical protein
MAVTESPPAIVSDIAARALFEEARRRRRRRYRWSAAVLVVVVAIVAGFALANRTGPPLRPALPPGELPQWTATHEATHQTPATYVAGDGKGGIGMYSTATGALIRTISPEESGDLDQEAMLSANRESVYFAQQVGSCSGVILRAPTSGANDPSVAISIPGTMALDPSPSPTSNDLAWIDDTCGASGTASTTTLYITNQTTHVTSQLGNLGSIGDAKIAWSRNGKQIAVENGHTIEVVAANSMKWSQAKSMEVANGCNLTSPAYLSGSNQLAAIRYCWSSPSRPSTSTALVFNVTRGKPIARIASAPRFATFQGLSIDRTGTHILLGVARPTSAMTVAIEDGRLVTVSSSSPTGAEW